MKSKRVSTQKYPFTSSLILTILIFYFRLIRATLRLRKVERQYRKTDLMIHMLKEKRDLLTLSRRVQHTPVSGLVVSEMVTESSSGQMAPDMKVNGKTIERMVKVNLRILTEIFMEVTGSMIKLMATVSIITSTAQCTKDTGVMTCNTAMVKKVGPMALSTKVNTWPAKSMVWAFTAGMMDQNTKVSGMKTKKFRRPSWITSPFSLGLISYSN